MNLKQAIFSAVLYFLVGSGANAFDSQFQIQKLATIGPLQHPVIFQSRDLRPLRGSAGLLTGHLVARWGVHVYEVGSVTYDCSSGICKVKNYARRSTFESCGLNSRQQMICKGQLGASSSADGATTPDFSARDLFLRNNIDGTQDYERPGSRYDGEEFPGRGQDDIDGRNQTDF